MEHSKRLERVARFCSQIAASSNLEEVCRGIVQDEEVIVGGHPVDNHFEV